MIIAFHLNTFGIRGSEIAVYDYALYNESILGNKSIIVVPSNYKNHKDVQGNIYYDLKIEDKFRAKFPVFVYDLSNLDEILKIINCDVLYNLKSGEKDSILSKVCYNCVHCVFVANEYEKHGFVYASISESVNGKNFRGENTNYTGSVVPHIAPMLPNINGNLREELNIPRESVVFGCYGGKETFNISFVQETINSISNKNIIFLFMNINRFGNSPNTIFLPKETDVIYKAKFINTCDAMIHARELGESFGLAISEFSQKNKPIITYKSDNQKKEEHTEHHRILGKNGIYYSNREELKNILTSFKPYRAENCYTEFSAENVMIQFDNIFLKPVRKIKNYHRVLLLSNFASSRELCQVWNKMTKSNYTWDNIQITYSDINIDYYVIINKPPVDIKFPKEKTIVLKMEALNYINDWYTKEDKFFYMGDLSYSRSNTEWHLSKTYSELVSKSPVKTKIFSTILSNQYKLPGHILRRNFVKYIQEKGRDIDIYGTISGSKGELPYHKKDDGIFPYKYTFNAENLSVNNYVTEKIFDGILGECLTFYWGCPNITKFFDKDCFVMLDLHDFEKSYKIIVDTIRNNEWEKRINTIRKEKEKILNCYNFLPRLKGIIRFGEMSTYVVNLDKRGDKFELFQSRAKKAGLYNYKRFSAITPEYTRKPEIYNKFFSCSKEFLRKNGGAQGCAMSHYKLWEICVQSNKPMLVLEDDVEFNEHFLDRIHMLCSVMDTTPWETLFIGWHPNETVIEFHKINETEIRNSDPFFIIKQQGLYQLYPMFHHPMGYIGGGTFGYLIKPSAAQKYISHVSKHGFTLSVDYEMLNLGQKYVMVDTYFCPNALVVSDKYADSDIKYQELSEEEREKRLKEEYDIEFKIRQKMAEK